MEDIAEPGFESKLTWDSTGDLKDEEVWNMMNATRSSCLAVDMFRICCCVSGRRKEQEVTTRFMNFSGTIEGLATIILR